MDKELEEALLILGDFWEADDDDQQKALDVAIRKMLKEGLSQHEIARLFGVCKNTITQIKQGKTYKWVIEEN